MCGGGRKLAWSDAFAAAVLGQAREEHPACAQARTDLEFGAVVHVPGTINWLGVTLRLCGPHEEVRAALAGGVGFGRAARR